MITIGAQYYRPPFPQSGYWRDDLERMRDAGLNTVQLWVVWGWVESQPGRFDFSDYDELVAQAERVGLNVVLSTIAAIHPMWIHREVPNSEMVTNMGHKVISTSRREVHYGLTPGGCLDHPGVRDRMAAFLDAAAARYAATKAVIGWDVWNELRWNVHADGLVCYCDHTVSAFRSWLEARYGSLAKLNDAWFRRYGSWDEVSPGKRPGRVYTEMMAFSEFLSDRSVEHARWRYRIVKAHNPGKPVTVHGGKPTILYGVDSYSAAEQNTTLHRGNDWGFAEEIDGVGTSSFPVWEKIDLTNFTSRIDFVRAAAEQYGKELWLSEVQGGRSAAGFAPQEAVTGAVQQRWVWTGIATGARTILFWCWRDEVFGRESGGFGIDGSDGEAEGRKAALRRTEQIILEHQALLEAYRPDSSSVGIWFSPRSYYLQWSEEGDAVRPMEAIQGVARALVRQSVPYTIVEEDHLDVLAELKLLYMPRVLVLNARQERALVHFVQGGGTIITESELGAFGENGVYRYPEERVFAEQGVVEIGRRPLVGDSVELSIELGGSTRRYTLPARQWTSPTGEPGLLTDQRVGAGRVIALGTYVAEACYTLGQRGGVEQFERFLVDIAAECGVSPSVLAVAEEDTRTSPHLHVRVGASNGTPVCFVISEAPERGITLVFKSQEWQAAAKAGLLDLISGTKVAAAEGHDVALLLPPSDWGAYVLAPAQ